MLPPLPQLQGLKSPSPPLPHPSSGRRNGRTDSTKEERRDGCGVVVTGETQGLALRPCLFNGDKLTRQEQCPLPVGRNHRWGLQGGQTFLGILLQLDHVVLVCTFPPLRRNESASGGTRGNPSGAVCACARIRGSRQPVGVVLPSSPKHGGPRRRGVRRLPNVTGHSAEADQVRCVQWGPCRRSHGTVLSRAAMWHLPWDCAKARPPSAGLLAEGARGQGAPARTGTAPSAHYRGQGQGRGCPPSSGEERMVATVGEGAGPWGHSLGFELQGFFSFRNHKSILVFVFVPVTFGQVS